MEKHMKRTTGSLFIAAVLVTVGFFTADARNGQGAYGEKASGKYDVATVEKITGTVEDTGTYERGGIHVTLLTASGKISVHLGPDYYINKMISIAKGDVLTVTGSRVKYNGADAIIARTVEKNGKTVTLRHEDGTPYWQGKGHRQ